MKQCGYILVIESSAKAIKYIFAVGTTIAKAVRKPTILTRRNSTLDIRLQNIADGTILALCGRIYRQTKQKLKHLGRERLTVNLPYLKEEGFLSLFLKNRISHLSSTVKGESKFAFDSPFFLTRFSYNAVLCELINYP